MHSERFHIAAVVMGLLVVCAVGRAADVLPNIPGVEWDELTRAIQAIGVAQTPDDAMAAYARGCSLNRQSVKLQDTHMRRMLKFGRPDVAYYPAQELTKLDAKNGIAWGVIGYIQARRQQYAAALANCLTAAELEKDNSSICQNAAQLLAWYEGAQRPPVSAEVADLAKKFKSSSYSGRVFADAYKKAREGYAKLDQEKAAKKKEADEADKEAKKVEQEAKKLKESLHARGRTYDAEKNRLYRAEQDLARAEDQVNRAGDYRARQNAERRRDQLARQINDTRKSLRDHLREGKKLRDQIDDLEKQYKSKRYQANRLLREADSVAQGVPSTFGWLPPAVDGVVTPDATAAKPTPRSMSKAPPKSSYLAPTKPTAPAAPPAASLDQQVSEAEAADKLSMAKICVNSKNAQMREKGKQLLQEILTAYPKTKAAAEAGELAKKLP